MSTGAEERIEAWAKRTNEGVLSRDIQEVLKELRTLRFAKEDRAKYGLSPVAVHNDLSLPNGFQLTRHSNVVFQTGPERYEYLSLTMPTTRDQGWIQVDSGDFTFRPTVQLRGGSLMLRAEKA